MTLNELIEELQQLRIEGYGDSNVLVAYYDEEYEPSPMAVGGEILI